MIFDFLKKQNNLIKKRKIIKLIIVSLNISEKQKELYIEAISILKEDWLENLYINLTNFTKRLELEELDNINGQNFSKIAWMRKKEIKQKQKELNSFSFLINNL